MAQAAKVTACDVCETDQDVKFFCVDCEVNLCSNCKTHHSKIKKTKNDKIILISEARNENITKTPVIYCRNHSAEEVTIYCRKCDQLICTECLIGKHKSHDIATLKQIKNIATDQLVHLKKKLQDRTKSSDYAVTAEGKVHSEYMTSLKQCKKGISDQKEKIIEELNGICLEEFAEISSLEEKEIKRYSEACANIQKHRQILTAALQTVQNALDSGHPATMLQAREDTTKSTEEFDDSIPTQLDLLEFQQATIEHQSLRQHLGVVHTIQTSHSQTIKEQEIDINKLKIKSTMTVKDKTKPIKVIIPTKNNHTWISAQGDNYLTLVNNNGDTIQTSVKVSENDIADAKPYNNHILVTCDNGQAVFQLSHSGKTKSTFSDLCPHITWGLCITNEKDVLVCLHRLDNKVVRLGKNGNIIQTIFQDRNGDPLYKNPYRVTALPSGEILVTQDSTGDVICVDRDGQHLFTWTGLLEGGQANEFSTYCITHDDYHVFITDFFFNKVYVLRKNGTGAQCLLDIRHGIKKPWGIASDGRGQLLVGCADGKIHVIQH